MRSVFVTLIALVASLALTSPAAESAPKIQVLLVTGDDVSPAHNWMETTAALREVLESGGRFEVRVCEDPGVLESASSLSRYDLVFLNLYNRKLPTLADSAKKNLLNFVQGGKGFTVAHLASASFKEWDEFHKLCGRYWVMGQSGHGPRSVFKATIADQNDPITKGLKDFEVDDELYAKLQGDEPIHVLVEAYSDWSKKTEPLAFTLKYGQGRVFHEAFGHDRKAIMTPNVATIIQRGCEWAATGQVR